MEAGLTFWGVDCGINSTAICAIGTGTPQLIGPRAGDGTVPQRMARLMEETERVAGQLCNDYPPMAVFVERPTGRHPSPHLGFAVGAVLIGLERALRNRFAYPVSIVLVPITEWKKSAVGKGNASKEEVMDWAVQTYPELDGMTQDEADALAVAHYAMDSLKVETAQP